MFSFGIHIICGFGVLLGTRYGQFWDESVVMRFVLHITPGPYHHSLSDQKASKAVKKAKNKEILCTPPQ